MSSTNSHFGPSGREFMIIGDGIRLKHGNQRTPDGVENKHPTVILIFGWMNAKLPHLLKYTQTYEQIYPGATQIIIQSFPSTFWISQKSAALRLAPVVEALEALGCIPPNPDKPCKSDRLSLNVSSTTDHRILVHAFSNGGAHQLVLLSRLLSQRHQRAPSPLPFIGCIVYDSCPGTVGLKRTIRAFTLTIQNTILRYLLTAFLALLYSILYLSALLTLRKDDPLTVLRASLNDPNLLPWTSRWTPRLYLFSKKDELVPWEAVEIHAAEAEATGFPVYREMFLESMHVTHAREEPERYWNAIENVWREALKRKN